MTRVVLVCHATIGERMAAAGIRYRELAHFLADFHEVTLAAPLGSSPEYAPGLALYDPQRPASLRTLIERADIVVSQPLAPRLIQHAAARRRRWIVDLLNPEPFEGLEQHRHRSGPIRRALEMVRIDRLTYAIALADAFICASERQRDMWLGFLAACRRLERPDGDPNRDLRSLIVVVPSGVPADIAAPAPEPVLRGCVLVPDARVLLWNGGVWGWLDPAMVIHALAVLRERDRRWALVFQGGVSIPPGTRVHSTAAEEVRALIERYAFDAQTVHVNEGWTPLAQRGEMLAEADVGVCAHPPTLEARFAFRNRLLDFVWARLPVVCTRGDPLAEDMLRHGWGEVIAPGDALAFAAAAERIVARGPEAYRQALDDAACRFAWPRMVIPLLELIESTGSNKRRPRGRDLVARVLGARHTAAGYAAGLARRA